MEALSQGLVVVSNYSHVVPEVDKWIPRPPILMVTSQYEIRDRITQLTTDDRYLRMRQEMSLTWANANLTSEATYAYWWRCLTTEL